MARRRIQRTFLWMAVVLAAVLIAVLVALVALGIPRNAAGMAAKGVCSAAFLAGRPWNTLIADDVLPASPALLPMMTGIRPGVWRIRPSLPAATAAVLNSGEP